MPRLSPESWREISAYLDRGLELPPAARAAWLAELRVREPERAPLVAQLLAEHEAVERERFLESSAAIPDELRLRGQRLGAYTLREPIGAGGMGSVWLAERSDGRFERRVAVKFLRLAVAAGGAERFAREGKILGQLAHPHIAELVDAGVSPTGEPYLILEYVEGEPIDEYCHRRGLDLQARIRLFLAVLDAVAAAHAHLIVHRDLKPANVLVRQDGQVKLLDFGIAKLLEEGAGPAAAHTLAGGALTPRFAAPEQFTGGPITTATDVYSLGVLLYLLLTGEHPAGAETQSTAQLVKAVVETEPPRPSDAAAGRAAAAPGSRGAARDKLRRELRGDLDTIVGKALRKNPAERYPSVLALAGDLRRFLRHEPITARPDTPAYRLRKYARRHRLGVAVAAALVLLLAGFSIIQAVELRRITRERDRADRVSDFMAGIFKLSDPNEHAGQPVTAREILDKAARDIHANLAQEPELRARMLHVMGRAYLNLGIFSRAQALFEEGIQASRAAGEENSRDTFAMTHDLAWALLQQNRVAAAERVERRLLADQSRVLGPADGDTLATMEELAFTVCNEGRGPCKEGIELTRRVLAAHERTLGPDAFYTLATMNNLAIMLASDGRLPEAVTLQQEALRRHLRRFGPDNIGTVNAMLNLGEFQRDAGQNDAAQTTLENLLVIEKRAFAPDQGETAATKYDLASVLLRKGQTDRALALLDDAVAHGLAPRIAQGLTADPLFASLRGDSRFQAITAAVARRYPPQPPSKAE